MSRLMDIDAFRPKMSRGSRIKFLAYLVAGVVFLAWSGNALELSPGELLHSLPSVIGRYIARMFPPDWSALDDLWDPTLDTICIAVWGTVIASIIGLPLGMLAAKNLSSSKTLRMSSALLFCTILERTPQHFGINLGDIFRVCGRIGTVPPRARSRR